MNLYEPVAESPAPTYCAKVSHAQLPDMPLQSGTAGPSLYRHVFLLSSGGKSVLLVKKKAAFT